MKKTDLLMPKTVLTIPSNNPEINIASNEN